ncbi:MAG: hydroxysqualene dehydroxylase HpnE [Hydrogenophaga sp.]|uniref:hydroxysqualene dehydroxylase HpnE n=1 Tax=Hydrogenophaga sp. TaxID=1904254 RepID=UPI00271F526A|nr:hydroxysqualene dehydroxylase HpnE [Hydrogenophaga sp.]MDO9148427.1 hydroxysqualene dehydroxylase HpnE [Hydrogenophaga sp.]MDO9605156.1 hydroxysqualene dehydroxylase HpnE [Hydrogenophaga sp.]
MKLAIVGAGWAGVAAAVEAADAGWDVTLFEATRTLGGRARALPAQRPDGVALTLDNGQHILIGAYTEALALMQRVGVAPASALLCLPLALPYPDGTGLQTPRWAARWPAPLDAVAAIATAKGWRWRERWALIRASLAWQRAGFACAPQLTVASLCATLPQRVMDELIEPLCVSALNLPAAQASAQVFLRVMRDALFGAGFGGWAASSLLLPRNDLSALLPNAAAQWLQAHHSGRTRLRLGTRVLGLEPQAGGWQLQGSGWQEGFDRVVWATAASPAAQAMREAAASAQAEEFDRTDALRHWADSADALAFTAITTVYAWATGVRLASPMLALRAEPDAQAAPAQFVFDRGQLAPHDATAQGVLAFVISASEGERDGLQARVLQQAAQQLGLSNLQALQTVVDKRATFACTPGLQRPAQAIAPGLWAAGDYVNGPYPATLEGAVRSGLAAARLL